MWPFGVKIVNSQKMPQFDHTRLLLMSTSAMLHDSKVFPTVQRYRCMYRRSVNIDTLRIPRYVNIDC